MRTSLDEEKKKIVEAPASLSATDVGYRASNPDLSIARAAQERLDRSIDSKTSFFTPAALAAMRGAVESATGIVNAGTTETASLANAATNATQANTQKFKAEQDAASSLVGNDLVQQQVTNKLAMDTEDNKYKNTLAGAEVVKAQALNLQAENSLKSVERLQGVEDSKMINSLALTRYKSLLDLLKGDTSLLPKGADVLEAKKQARLDIKALEEKFGFSLDPTKNNKEE